MLEEGLPLTPLPPETDYIKRRSVSNTVNLMKIAGVIIVFFEALHDPTSFIILLNIDLFYTNWK